MNKEVEFYNFPIVLLRGVFSGETCKDEFLLNILKFHIYKKYLEMPYAEFDETARQRFSRCAKFWGCTIPSEIINPFFEDAETIYNSSAHSRVKTGIKISTFWEFMNEDKSELEWNSFLAFLALKSIILFGKFRQSTNDMLFARMNGFATVSEYLENGRCELKEFRRKKLIDNLEVNWNLKYYARQIRGFYFGFDISLKELITIVESKRAGSKKKKIDEEKKRILQEIRNQDHK